MILDTPKWINGDSNPIVSSLNLYSGVYSSLNFQTFNYSADTLTTNTALTVGPRHAWSSVATDEEIWSHFASRSYWLRVMNKTTGDWEWSEKHSGFGGMSSFVFLSFFLFLPFFSRKSAQIYTCKNTKFAGMALMFTLWPGIISQRPERILGDGMKG